MEFGAINQVQVLSTTNRWFITWPQLASSLISKALSSCPSSLSRFRWQRDRGSSAFPGLRPHLHSPRSVHSHLLALSLALQAGCSIKDLSTTLSPHLVLTPPAPERKLLLIRVSMPLYSHSGMPVLVLHTGCLLATCPPLRLNSWTGVISHLSTDI